MGVLQRFERRLEGLVEGAFARAFGGVVEPVEVAAALVKEAGDKKAIVGQGRVLVPNAYVVELGASDAERLSAYDAPLRAELAAMVREHATEQGWSFVGPVTVGFEQVPDLGTGVFRVRSSAVAETPPPADEPVTHEPVAHQPYLDRAGRRIALTLPVLVVGRSPEAGLRLDDDRVSRRHVEFRTDGEGVTITDLGSTNGTRVNGTPVTTARLGDGDRIGVGSTELIFRTGA